EKGQGRRVVRVTIERTPQVLLRALAAAAEQPWNGRVPLSERRVGQAALPRRVDGEHPLELLLDSRAILERLNDPKRLAESSHVGGQPEMPFRAIACEANRALSGVDAAVERGSLLCFGLMRAEPVAGARELPRRVEVGDRSLGPQVRRAG